MEARGVAMKYHRGFSSNIKAELVRIEKKVRERRVTILSEDTDDELKIWIPDTSFSHSCNTKYFRKIDIYWKTQTKSIVAQVIEEQGKQQKAILCKLEFLDQKYEALIKTLWDMEVMGKEKNQPKTSHLCKLQI
jgi:hypothetical protein